MQMTQTTTFQLGLLPWGLPTPDLVLLSFFPFRSFAVKISKNGQRSYHRLALCKCKMDLNWPDKVRWAMANQTSRLALTFGH